MHTRKKKKINRIDLLALKYNIDMDIIKLYYNSIIKYSCVAKGSSDELYKCLNLFIKARIKSNINKKLGKEYQTYTQDLETSIIEVYEKEKEETSSIFKSKDPDIFVDETNELELEEYGLKKVLKRKKIK